MRKLRVLLIPMVIIVELAALLLAWTLILAGQLTIASKIKNFAFEHLPNSEWYFDGYKHKSSKSNL